MKYEPTQKLNRFSSPIERLMMPFYDDEALEPNWELLDIVNECNDKLSPQDQEILHRIFFLRETYEELASNIGTKAKSHAWRKTRKAMQNLQEELLKHERFKEIWNGKQSNNMG